MNKYLSILLAICLFIFSCNDDPVNPTDNYHSDLSNIAQDVILRTYLELRTASDDLKESLAQLATAPTEQNLLIARNAWIAARSPWEKSEGFLFGPVDQQGIDPSIDSWPVNETDLDAVLNSGQALTKSFVDGLDGTLKGFHTIEYLLYGSNGNKSVSDFTARQFEYLSACGQSLAGATTQLHHSWDPNGENFIENLISAGEAGQSIYPSQKSALQEIVNGMIVIADEVANGKINDPFSQQDITLEESRFSANSKKDFADNIRSIQNVYTGRYDAAIGLGISNIIKSQNSALDESIKQKIASAINAIESIEGTFTSAIFNAQQSVINAQTEVRDLQQLLESEVLPIITNL
jgi:uncharacterized iron-regulated protein